MYRFNQKISSSDWRCRHRYVFIVKPIYIHIFDKTLGSFKWTLTNWTELIFMLWCLLQQCLPKKYIKITQTSNCWFDRMIYFPIIRVMSVLFWGTSEGSHGCTVSAGTRLPVVSSCMHLHVHADTGHSAWSLNQLSICPACPPCRQLWHQVNQLLNWANFLSLLKSTFSSDLDPPGQLETGVPILMRQSAHRGRGFRQPGQLVTFDFVGEPLTPYWLKPLPWWGTEEQL